MQAKNPYRGLPGRAFWKTGVRQQQPETVQDLYARKFEISATDCVATAGSCFAQHIAKRMRESGYSVLDVEPAPRGMSERHKMAFGYGIYSARYGNIYTARQLLQLVEECRGRFEPANIAWEKAGRWYDAVRPNVEPMGHASPEEVRLHRNYHLRHVRGMLKRTDVFVFTFGLTEGWVHTESGTVYPTAPGVLAGEYDPEIYSFKNFTYEEILGDFIRVRKILQKINPNMRFIITVSPVPLAATASGEHVLSSNTYSKSVLRTVAGALASRFPDVDYFPSYEIIASSFSGGKFYEEDQRNVRSEGVDTVMRTFFAQHPPVVANKVEKVAANDDVVCEEVLLEAFGAR